MGKAASIAGLILGVLQPGAAGTLPPAPGETELWRTLSGQGKMAG
jgi:hypothetical protein